MAAIFHTETCPPCERDSLSSEQQPNVFTPDPYHSLPMP